MSQRLLSINNLFVSAQDKPVLNGINLALVPGSIHWLLGPNGSGKSSLAMAIIGHPRYKVTGGAIIFSDADITTCDPHLRAHQGIFATFQNPVDIPGVSIYSLLKEAYRAKAETIFSFTDFDIRITEAARALALDLPLLQRPLQGFSGGQKKKLEILQLLVLEPKLVILDEIDAGLDVDSCKLIGQALQELKRRKPDMSFLVISHQQQLSNYLQPEIVHVMQNGSIIQSGSVTLFDRIMQRGFNECAP